jgi:hypothetical protein
VAFWAAAQEISKKTVETPKKPRDFMDFTVVSLRAPS